MTSLLRRQDKTGFPGNLMRSFFNDPFFSTMSLLPEMTTNEAAMPLDVSETDTHVIVRASLPGFTKDQVAAEVHDGVLSLTAKAEETTEDSGERYHWRERQWRSMSRHVVLPVSVEESEAKAELSNGVLTLHLPKSQKAQVRKIRIS